MARRLVKNILKKNKHYQQSSKKQQCWYCQIMSNTAVYCVEEMSTEVSMLTS